MLRGGWRYVLATVGLALAATLSPNNEAAAQDANPYYSPAYPPDELAWILEQTHEAPSADQPCKQGEDNRSSDLCAQWKAADAAADSAFWTWAGFVAGCVGVGVGFATLIAAGAAAYFAKQAAQASTQSAQLFQKSECGLLTPCIVPSPEGVTDEEARSLFVKNVGRSQITIVSFHVLFGESTPYGFKKGGPGFGVERCHAIIPSGDIYSLGLIDENVATKNELYGVWVNYVDVFNQWKTLFFCLARDPGKKCMKEDRDIEVFKELEIAWEGFRDWLDVFEYTREWGSYPVGPGPMATNRPTRMKAIWFRFRNRFLRRS